MVALGIAAGSHRQRLQPYLVRTVGTSEMKNR
jgi:hypothetical protein